MRDDKNEKGAKIQTALFITHGITVIILSITDRCEVNVGVCHWRAHEDLFQNNLKLEYFISKILKNMDIIFF